MIIALSFLLLVKQIGLEYFCLCYLLLTLIGILDYKACIDKRCIFIKNILLFIIPVAFRISWNIYVKVNHISGQFTLSKFDMNIFKSVVMRTDINTWQYKGTIGFFNALFTKPLIIIRGYAVSYADLFAIYVIVYFFLFLLQKRAKKDFCVFPLFVTYIISAVGHVMMMWISYMFLYCESDFTELACWERYMNVIWIFNGIVLVFLFLEIFFEVINNVCSLTKTSLNLLKILSFLIRYSIIECRKNIRIRTKTLHSGENSCINSNDTVSLDLQISTSRRA